ncbi:MAG: DNA translocase FtsK 4TM domain-containing protein [Rhodospirillales bacterium]|nr:DNA translocase FtsK 4TM domain-containing protein [Rhodospirillales bacterium]
MPERWQAFMARRLIDVGGGIFGVSGLFILLAIASYHHADPSWNTAAVENAEIANWLGAAGAGVADLLVQTLGLGGLVFGAVLSVWGFRIVRRQPFFHFWARAAAMMAGALLASMAFARLSAGDWMLTPYLGGSGGTLLLDRAAAVASPFSAGFEHSAMAGLAAVLALATILYAMAVSRSEIKFFASRVWYGAGCVALGVFNAVNAFYGWVRHYGDPDYVAPAPRQPKIAKPVKEKKEKKMAPSISAEEAAFFDPPMAAPMAAAPQASIQIAAPKKAARAGSQTSFTLGDGGTWELPSTDLLQELPEEHLDDVPDEEALRRNAELLQSVLRDFNVEGEIVSIHPGPVVTLYELEPAPGVKTQRVISLADDIARSMAAISVRCAVIPGRNVIGIELPNKTRQTVFMRELLETREVQNAKAHLPIVLGKDIGGHPIIADLARMPHLLVAGTTGSGKSVAVNTMILSLLYRLPPEKCRFIMIDPKMLELSVYDDIPHLLAPVVTEPGKAIVSLKWTVQEMEERYRAMSKLGVRNIEGYNERLRQALKKGETLMRKVQTGFDPDTGKPVFEDQPFDMKELPYIVVVVDEFADLMLVAGKDVENAIQRLAQMARAAGIHLIMATQRPSVDVITGVIKANFPTRISFQVTSKIDSRTILGEGGAEQLLGMGDMLYMAAGGRIKRVHGPFTSDEDVENVVNYLKAQGEPQYLDDITEGGDFGDSEVMGALFGDGEGGDNSVDELYDQAVAIVARERKASTSFIQRHLQIGYNRAARIIEEMERQGVVTKASPTGKREVLVGDYSDA